MAATNLIGVDVGGTFTDLILMDEATGQVRIAKVPTTVRNQADGSVRMEFSARGPKGSDPGLAGRISRAYDRRMGR